MALGIRDGQIVKIWAVEDKGKFAVVRMSSSRKDKQTNEYKSSNWAFVRFVGEAYNKIKSDGLSEGDLIELHGASISLEPYMDNGEKKFPKSTSITVFNWECKEAKPSTYSQEELDEEEANIPF